MSNKTLLILAGMPAVGKKTLCIDALKNGIQIFGSTFDSKFRSVTFPETLPEWGTPCEERLSRGTWFFERDIPYLLYLNELPDVTLLHLDLHSTHHVLQDVIDPPEGLKSLVCRGADGYSDDLLNEESYRFVLSLPVFSRFDTVVITTLYSAFSQAYSRSLIRSDFFENSDDATSFYKITRSPESAYLSCYRAWLRALIVLKPTEIYWANSSDVEWKFAKISLGS